MSARALIAEGEWAAPATKGDLLRVEKDLISRIDKVGLRK